MLRLNSSVWSSAVSGLHAVFEYLPSHSLIPHEGMEKAPPTHSKAWKEGLEPQSSLHTYTHPHPPIQTVLLSPPNRDVSDSNNTNVGYWNGVVLKAPWAPAAWWVTRSWSKSGLRSSPAPDISQLRSRCEGGECDPLNMMSAIFVTDSLLLPVDAAMTPNPLPLTRHGCHT